MTKTDLKRCAMAALATLACGPTFAALLSFNGQNYGFTTSETVTTPFNSAAGIATTGQYSGLVLLTVSNQGNGAWGSTLNDAFGYINQSTRIDCGSLAVRTGVGLPGGCGRYALDAIVYDVDQDQFVSTAGGHFVGTFRADHTYSYVISVDKLLAAAGQSGAQRLFFGTTDNNYGDNGGSFSVQVAQLTEASLNAAPEPGSLALVALGALVAAGRRLRSRRPGC